jgi:hypothetical protein
MWIRRPAVDPKVDPSPDLDLAPDPVLVPARNARRLVLDPDLVVASLGLDPDLVVASLVPVPNRDPTLDLAPSLVPALAVKVDRRQYVVVLEVDQPLDELDLIHDLELR